MEVTKVTNLYDLLLNIRARPSMYLRKEPSLDDLEEVCRWYQAALGVHGIQEFGTGFNQRFSDFLYRRFRWSMACGWARGIREHLRGTETEFERFFKLLEQFKRATEVDGKTAK